MHTFKQYSHKKLNEEFDAIKAVKDAEQWLKNKYGEDTFTFKNIENMDMTGDNIKVYDISVGDSQYQLNLRKFDSNGDGENDTVGFDVLPSTAEAPEDDEDEKPEL